MGAKCETGTTGTERTVPELGLDLAGEHAEVVHALKFENFKAGAPEFCGPQQDGEQRGRQDVTDRHRGIISAHDDARWPRRKVILDRCFLLAELQEEDEEEAAEEEEEQQEEDEEPGAAARDALLHTDGTALVNECRGKKRMKRMKNREQRRVMRFCTRRALCS